MAETKQDRTDHPNHQAEMYPRDLLRRFGGGGRPGDCPVVLEVEPMEVELSLGLSLGGSFGVDPKQKGLVRSSSISAFSCFPEEKEEQKGLVRTCSLPVETGEEQRKRKELQCLRRLEVKRKRSEKRGLKLENEMQHFQVNTNGIVSSISLPRVREQQPHCPRGVQGGCSTSSSDFDCHPMEGLDISGLRRSNSEAARIPSTITPVAKDTENLVGCIQEVKASDPSKLASKGSSEMARSMMAEMPCVSTKGDGPNGRRVEGFLYKYHKGEDVRIVCVCHGSFLTPAEFVKHAGGSDVEFPLRHIVVYPSPQTFL